MRVLVVALLDFKPHQGGVAEYTHQVAARLQRHGSSVVVITGVPDDGRVSFDADCSYPVHRLRLSSLHRPSVAGAVAVVRFARQLRPDVIICNSAPHSGAAAWWAARKLEVPFCLLAYGKELLDHCARPLPRLNRSIGVRKADGIVSCSRATQEAVVQRYGVSRARCTVAYPGIGIRSVGRSGAEEEPRAGELPVLDERPLILSLFRLVERKGVDCVIRAMPTVLRQLPECAYVVAGDGPQRGELEALVDQLGLGDSVHFKGRVSDEEKERLLAACDVFAMPNRRVGTGDVEGFGIVFLEAAAYAKPVVAGRSGGAVEAVVDGETGLLVDPLDPEEVGGALSDILTDSRLARRLGNAAQERARARFDWDETLLPLIDRLEQLTAANHGRDRPSQEPGRSHPASQPRPSQPE